MRPADIATVHREALRTLAAVDCRGLWLLIADQRTGYPTGGYDVVRGTSGDSSTETAALAPDSAADALRDLSRLMGTLQRAAAALEQMNAMWTATPKRATCDHCGDFTGERYRTHCRWCTSWLSDTGELPAPKDIAQRQTGGRPRRPKTEAA